LWWEKERNRRGTEWGGTGNVLAVGGVGRGMVFGAVGREGSGVGEFIRQGETKE